MSDGARVSQAERDLKALEMLVVGNEDLERLQTLLERFNIFEAIGVVRQEVRHSDFLAYLLDPRGNHGFRDAFVKRLLQNALTSNNAVLPVSPIDLDLWDLGQARVLREEHRIDVLLLDDAHRLAVIVENKIGGKEHGSQLRRYREAVLKEYPDWDIVCLYLTPEGEEPSDENYLPIDYGLLYRLVEELAESRASVLGADVRTLMVHYAQMLRRHIVSESEIAELCRRIYRKHQRALDLIYEHRPDRQADLREFLEGLIHEQPAFILDDTGKNRIRFMPKGWDKEVLRAGEEWAGQWTRSRRMLMFEFNNRPDGISITLYIGPGPEEIRQKLLDMALRKGRPFNPRDKSLNRKWNSIFSSRFVRLRAESQEEEDDEEEIKQEIRKRWERFLEEDLPRIDEAIKAEPWIWQQVAD